MIPKKLPASNEATAAACRTPALGQAGTPPDSSSRMSAWLERDPVMCPRPDSQDRSAGSGGDEFDRDGRAVGVDDRVEDGSLGLHQMFDAGRRCGGSVVGDDGPAHRQVLGQAHFEAAGPVVGR